MHCSLLIISVMQTLEAGTKGFAGAGLDFIQWAESGVAGALGISDSYVDRQRLYRQSADAWDVKNLNYMSASGKKVSVGGTNYLVSDDGTIYDVDAGYVANGSLDEATSAAILDGAKESKRIWQRYKRTWWCCANGCRYGKHWLSSFSYSWSKA